MNRSGDGAVKSEGPKQDSPDKNVVFRSPSSPFTSTVDWGRLRDVVLTLLTDPAT